MYDSSIYGKPCRYSDVIGLDANKRFNCSARLNAVTEQVWGLVLVITCNRNQPLRLPKKWLFAATGARQAALLFEISSASGFLVKWVVLSISNATEVACGVDHTVDFDLDPATQ